MKRIIIPSYLIFIAVLVVVDLLDLATPLLTVLFSYFALNKLHFTRKKVLSIGLFIAIVSSIIGGAGAFVHEAATSLPTIVSDSVPAVLKYAQSFEQRFGMEMPFNDAEGLRSLVASSITEQVGKVAKFAEVATFEFVYLIVGFVVAIGLFLNPNIDLHPEEHRIKNNLYSVLLVQIGKRFSMFYKSFSTVIGAQLIISGINTILTTGFVYAMDLPYRPVIIVVTFLCGLLPIIGNIISNSIIFLVAIKISLSQAVWALIFLVILHKFEYFLNSKIIGSIIRNPMWLTLIALMVGQRVMGVPGMILAPVVLNYLKLESLEIELGDPDEAILTR